MADPTSAASLPPSYMSAYSGDKLRDVTAAFIALETIFVSLRYMSQKVGRKPFGLDDWLMIPAFITNLGVCVSAIVSLHVGSVGYHLIAVEAKNPESLIPWAKVLVVTPIIYSAAVCFPKIVLLVLYHRIFTTTSFRIANYIIMAIVIGIAIADILVGALVCIPLNAFWNHSVKGTCVDVPTFYRFGTLPNAITDLVMLILPLPVIWKLQTSRRNKIGLTLTFLTGSVGTVASILRCVAFFKTNPIEDGTWTSVTFLRWSVIEPGCYLIAACLPCYRPLLNYITNNKFDPDHKTETRSNLFMSLSKFFTSYGNKSGSSAPYADLSKAESYPMSSGDHGKGFAHGQSRDSDEENLVHR